MKRRILSVLCIAAMLLSLAAMPAFAEGTYKVFAEADFDETFCFGIDKDSTALGSDNGNKYLASNSFYSLAEGPAKKMVVIDMRARSNGTNYSNLKVRDSGSVNWNRQVSVQFKDSSWKYYRFIYNFETHTTESYSSSTGWGDLRKFSPTVGWPKDSDSAYAADMNSVSFSDMDVDELKIYQYGSAPTAVATVARNGSTLSAAYTYSDAEEDAQAGVKFQWQSSDDNAAFTDIAGATEQTFNITEDYSGKYIRCAVTVISRCYPAESAPAYSNAVLHKVYKSHLDQNFEGESIVPFTGTVVEGDDVNKTKYLQGKANIDVKNLSISTEDAVVEFRAKLMKDATNKTIGITFIKDKSWSKTAAYTVDQSTKDSWYYYRFVLPKEGAAGIKVFVSEDRTAWRSAGREVGKFEPSSSIENNLAQIRFSRCDIDDVKIYQNGTAPVGSGAQITREGDILTAGFTYTDDSGETQGKTKYRWQRSDDGSTYTDINGAVNNTYELCNADRGKCIRVKIVPVSCSYPTDGDEIEASFGAVNAFTTSKIGVISYTVENNTLTASAEVTRTAENETAMFVAAAYDSNGVLNKVLKSDVTDISNAVGINKDFDISGIADGSTIKLMLWQNMKTLAPLTGAVDVKK